MTHKARKRQARPCSGSRRHLAAYPCTTRPMVAGVRDQIQRRLGERLLVDGFVPMGYGGSKLECPHTGELEARLKPGGKADSNPIVGVTAFVHLGTGLLWYWRLGPGAARPQRHLCRLLNTLPRLVLCHTSKFG